MGIINSLQVRAALIGITTFLGYACAMEEPRDVVVGSRHMDALSIDAPFVEHVSIALPFQTLVYNGEPGKFVARGEDNLIRQIEVKETSAGKWQISAPFDIEFEQHADVELEVPFMHMIKISVDAEHVDFADNPSDWMASHDG
ncbi:MAG TPA: hypothetical protein VJV78_38310 [Polyangiales bacterium]|nr:hypothetical protein [Polyangiales bacterium]